MRNNLIELRNAIGFTQTEMAKLVGCTRGQWCNVENGSREGSADMWLKLAIILGLSVEQTIKLKEVS